MSALYREFPLHGAGSWNALVAFVKANARACLDRGRPLRVIVTADERKRNGEQNRRYWGLLLKTIAEQAWVEGRQFDKDTWHEYLARRFGVCDEVTLPGGEVVVRRKSTTQMNVGEFTAYMAEVEAFAVLELGVAFE